MADALLNGLIFGTGLGLALCAVAVVGYLLNGRRREKEAEAEKAWIKAQKEVKKYGQS